MKSKLLQLCVSVLVLTLSAFGAVTTCSMQGFTHASPGQLWYGVIQHSSGSHQLGYTFVTRCSYTDVQLLNNARCNTDQITQANFLTGDTGTVTGAPDAYHALYPRTQVVQVHAYQTGTTSTPTNAGVAVQRCSHILGCSAVTVTIPPFTVTGGNIIETDGGFVYVDYCPTAYYHVQSGDCTCKRCGCSGCPLMIDVGESGTDIWQLTGVRDGIVFDLKNTGQPVRIAWPKPGSTLAVLVLPDEDGKIRNSNQLFGNYTPQPTVSTCGPKHDQVCPRNGFAALLAACRKADPNGCKNSVLTKNDAIYYQLRLLLGKPDDPNHKLLTLPEGHIDNINLTWREVENEGIEDSHGNLFKYEGEANFGVNERFPHTRWMYDVYLLDENVRGYEDPE